SAPVNPSPSTRTLGSSLRFANAMRKRRRSSARTSVITRTPTSALSTLRRPHCAGAAAARTLFRSTRSTSATLIGLLNRLDVDERAGRSDRLRDRHREEESRALGGCRRGGNQVRAHVLDNMDSVVRK